MREVNIMVGGILELVPLDQLRTRANQIWIGVDYGATFLLDHGITPQVALGDFDSTPAPLLQRLEERGISLTTFPRKGLHRHPIRGQAGLFRLPA